MTLICVSILVHEEAPALEDAFAARDAGADLVEFRIDEFFSGDEPDAQTRTLLRLVATCPLPCIVTCRTASEGGGYDGDEADRIALYERLANTLQRKVGEVDGREVLEHPPRYIDVEWASYSRSANIRQKVKLAIDHPDQLRDLKTSLILSMHDLNGRPADLNRRVLAMSGEPSASVIKVAYRARSLRDSLELLDLPSMLGRPTIALGMGEFGLMSRVLAPKFGGFLTFASLRPQSATAPGQPTIRELLDLYRFRAIGPATAVYGVVGWPVEHSRSPHVHNAGFEAIGLDAVYVPLPVAGGSDAEASFASFKATVLDLIHHPKLDFRGCSVTIPHKENLLRLAVEQSWEVEAEARAIGAANTLAIRGDRMRVLNTDAPAAAQCLREAVGPLDGRRIGILGAGGMARGAAFALASTGAEVVVTNRSRDRAERVVEAVNATFPGRASVAEDATSSPLDAIVNCTPVGMAGGPDARGTPIDLDRLASRSPGVVVVDSVYRPVRTPLLEGAHLRGLRVVDGVGLFAMQASRQFEAWTGRQAPIRLFERIIREHESISASTGGA